MTGAQLYDQIGTGYSFGRRTDPRWMAAMLAAVGDAGSIIDVGAGRPVREHAADVALAVLTVHHWTDWRRGLAELRRVAPRQVVLAYDTRRHAEFWFVREYVPEIAELELTRPAAADIANELDADTVTPMPLPWDFTDGVFPACWRRPAAYLDPRVRRACSALAQTAPAADLLALDQRDAGFRLIASHT